MNDDVRRDPPPFEVDLGREGPIPDDALPLLLARMQRIRRLGRERPDDRLFHELLYYALRIFRDRKTLGIQGGDIAAVALARSDAKIPVIRVSGLDRIDGTPPPMLPDRDRPWYRLRQRYGIEITREKIHVLGSRMRSRNCRAREDMALLAYFDDGNQLWRAHLAGYTGVDAWGLCLFDPVAGRISTFLASPFVDEETSRAFVADPRDTASPRPSRIQQGVASR